MNNQLYEFGKRVRESRNLKKMTQEELADAAGLDRTYISSVERGRRNISLLNILKISRALGVNPSFLLEVLNDEN